MHFKSKNIRISLILFIIIVCFVAFYIFKFLSTANRNTVKYISVNKCSDSSNKVISAKNLPKDKIVSCESVDENYNNQKAKKVTIYFGKPNDCPAGCFYSRFVGYVVSDTGETVASSYDNYDN